MSRVVVAGSVNMDVVATAARHPLVGETVPASDLRFFPGGKGANQAVAAARAGASTALVGVLGTDAFGDQLASFLASHKLDLTHLRRSADAPTGTALIVLARGDNSIVVFPGANGLVSADDVARAPLHAGDVLVSQFEVPLDSVAAFFARGKREGCRTILNPAPAHEIPARLARATDVLVVNETELATLAREPSIPAGIAGAAASLRATPEQTIVVTLGADGVLVCAPEEITRIPGRPVPVVDTTGAGDCFVGALAARLAAGDSIEAAARFANAAASICVQRSGAGISMPDAADVAAVL